MYDRWNYPIPNIRISAQRKAQLRTLAADIDHDFMHWSLLDVAMTHSSYANENKGYDSKDNERLEFLGDTVLNLVASDVLFKKYPDVPEGELTKKRSVIVSEPTFAYAARLMRLGDYMRLGRGEELSGGAERDSLLADAFEALWGAVYIDTGYEKTYRLLVERFESIAVEATSAGNLFRDYKTQLQEHFQRTGKDKVCYTMIMESGPDHDKIFTMAAHVGPLQLGVGSGKSKKEAEQMAAREALVRAGLLHP